MSHILQEQFTSNQSLIYVIPNVFTCPGLSKELVTGKVKVPITGLAKIREAPIA